MKENTREIIIQLNGLSDLTAIREVLVTLTMTIWEVSEMDCFLDTATPAINVRI
jgi:hypothetical protein